MEMVKLLFYLSIGFLIILTTLNDANGVPIRIIPRTRIPITTTSTRKTESAQKILNKESTRKGSLVAMKENFKIHPGFQKKLERKNITHSADEDNDHKVTESTNINKSKEITLSKLHTNKMPKNFLEFFAVTAMAPRKYYPNTKLETVCFDRSTIYNKPAVKNYLKTQLPANWHIWWVKTAKYRPYFMSLRKLLFDEGRSEECHTRKHDKLLRYLNCALLRHMRMEYLIPMYPLHQIYFHDRTTTVDFILYH